MPKKENPIAVAAAWIKQVNEKLSDIAEKYSKTTLVIRIDGWLWRVIAMTWAITEVAKHRRVKVVTSRPLVFWGNPYIESVHWLDDRDLFASVIRWNDYIELEPYTDPAFFNDATNWLDVAAKQLGIEWSIPQPCLFLAEHEKLNNYLGGNKPILFQPFGSTMQLNGSDKSYSYGVTHMMRRILCQTNMDANQDYYIRFRVASEAKQGNNNEFMFDFFEMVPKSVYGVDGDGEMEDAL